MPCYDIVQHVKNNLWQKCADISVENISYLNYKECKLQDSLNKRNDKEYRLFCNLNLWAWEVLKSVLQPDSRGATDLWCLHFFMDTTLPMCFVFLGGDLMAHLCANTHIKRASL